METTVTELDNSRARIDVEVDPEEVQKRVEAMARRLGKEMKQPGFREGKVPPEMVVQKVGREAVLVQALEDSLSDWYERSLIDSGIDPVGDPKLDVSEMPGEGEPLRFSIEVGIRPPAKLDNYKGLEVGRAEIPVPPDAVDSELERLREGFAKLKTVDREAREGDVLLIDFKGTIDAEEFEGGEGRDYLLELGSNQVVEGFEEALKGAKAGDTREAAITFPEDYPAEQLRGKEAKFSIDVKEVREKELPALDDDFAAEASEFDTLEELRSHIEGRIKEVLDARADEAFREAALDVAAEAATVDLPEELIEGRAEQLWARVERSLRERGVDPDRYLQAQSRTKEQMVEEAKKDAERGLRREATLEAVADAEGIEVTDEDLIEALTPPPGHEDHDHPDPKEALEKLKESGRDKLLRADLRMRRALDVIAAEAKPIPVEQAEAREKLWTPEKEREEKGALWTPGSDAE